MLGFQNVPDGNVAELLKTAERDPLHLIAFFQHDHLCGIYVIGVTIGVPISSVESAVLTLFASYYVFNVDTHVSMPCSSPSWSLWYCSNSIEANVKKVCFYGEENEET